MEEEAEKTSIWALLPDELRVKIFGESDLSFQDLLRASHTCRKWRRLVWDNSVGQSLLSQLPHIPPKKENEAWIFSDNNNR